MNDFVYFPNVETKHARICDNQITQLSPRNARAGVHDTTLDLIAIFFVLSFYEVVHVVTFDISRVL